MANIKSNEKRHIQDQKKHLLNHMQMSKLKTQIKKTKLTKSQDDLNKAYKIIDQCLSKGIISSNKANRLKSRTTLFLSRNVDTTETKKVTRKRKTQSAKGKKVLAKKAK